MDDSQPESQLPPDSQIPWDESPPRHMSQLSRFGPNPADLISSQLASSQVVGAPPPSQPVSTPSQPNSTPVAAAAATVTVGTRMQWTSDLDRIMLEKLLDAKKQGKDTDNTGFKAAAWNLALKAVRDVTSHPVTKASCENRWRRLKAIWIKWEKHKQQISGWTWDPERETYVSDKEVMDDYFKAHPEMEIFRERGPSNQDITAQLLDGRLATLKHGMGIRAALNQVREKREALENAEDEPEPVMESVEGDSGQVNPTTPIRTARTPARTPAIRTPVALQDELASPSFGRDTSVTPAESQPRRSAVVRAANTAAKAKERARDRERPTKRSRLTDIATGMSDVSESIVESAWQLSRAMLNPHEKATGEFMKEMNELLPASWKGTNGRIPFSKFGPFMRVLNNQEVSVNYLALMAGTKEDRFEYLASLVDPELLVGIGVMAAEQEVEDDGDGELEGMDIA